MSFPFPSIQDTEVFTSSNFSSSGKTLLNDLFGIKNFLAIKEIDIFDTYVITLMTWLLLDYGMWVCHTHRWHAARQICLYGCVRRDDKLSDKLALNMSMKTQQHSTADIENDWMNLEELSHFGYFVDVTVPTWRICPSLIQTLFKFLAAKRSSTRALVLCPSVRPSVCPSPKLNFSLFGQLMTAYDSLWQLMTTYNN